MDYKDDPTYKALARLASEAGMRIDYVDLSDDLLARTRDRVIQMPKDGDAFGDDFEYACMVLGHEMCHEITGLDSSDFQRERVRNEAVCDLAGVFLFQLAEAIAGHEAETALMEAAKAYEQDSR